MKQIVVCVIVLCTIGMVQNIHTSDRTAMPAQATPSQRTQVPKQNQATSSPQPAQQPQEEQRNLERERQALKIDLINRQERAGMLIWDGSMEWEGIHGTEFEKAIKEGMGLLPDFVKNRAKINQLLATLDAKIKELLKRRDELLDLLLKNIQERGPADNVTQKTIQHIAREFGERPAKRYFQRFTSESQAQSVTQPMQPFRPQVIRPQTPLPIEPQAVPMQAPQAIRPRAIRPQAQRAEPTLLQQERVKRRWRPGLETIPEETEQDMAREAALEEETALLRQKEIVPEPIVTPQKTQLEIVDGGA